ncbi:MAG TPA: 23S rRNA (guanosine(2251)-2'-O)-methyltransferase RlmB [Steroidobacteraceae bacterium]|nr:23S rRNA (guanosine(2251)-2'-O)-methyltransferase RlmB [Steroidobacteraceae bacterium]
MAPERVYGLHAVRALLSRAPQRVHKLWLQQGRHDPRAAELEALARSAQRPIERADGARLRGWLGDVAHQGVMAEIEALPPLREDDFYARLAESPEALILALDGVQDPHNLGACLRSADACGVLAVVVPRDRAAPLSAAARKVAAGAAESTPVVTVTNLARSLRLIKEAGLWIVGADAGATLPASGVDLTGGRCLVLGAEGAGMRELTRRSCDWLVSLPALGAVESLNVSVAAGMLLYEAVRQRQASRPK